MGAMYGDRNERSCGGLCGGMDSKQMYGTLVQTFLLNQTTA